MKFAETIKAGYYLYEDNCMYLTGTLKGNKWIDLNVHEPRWMSLLWSCITKDDVDLSTYHIDNPTNFKL